MESRIAILKPEVASQIAAGEVIERPASIVKELVENSLDADAKHINIELHEGGKTLIRVADDGIGMSSQEAFLSLERHSTSKIRSAEDLEHVTTFGFRGEALPSISSVSQIDLITRESNTAVGVKINASGGKTDDIVDVGSPKGTTVTVRNLFFNTPARLKFSKSAQAEIQATVSITNRFVLSHPTVSFTLTHNGRELLNHGGSNDSQSALVTVLGRDEAAQMLTIESSTEPITVLGFSSKPSLTRPNRARQFFFVNGRFIRHRALSHAVFNAYNGLIPTGRHAVCALMIKIDPSLMDVNVHPQKLEVRFKHEGEVHHAVGTAIQSTLANEQLIPEIIPQQHASFPTRSKERDPNFPSQTQEKNWTNERNFGWTAQPTPMPTEQPPHHQAEAIFKGTSLRPIAQLHSTYILAEGNEGLFIISQHRAHERVLLEQSLSDNDGKIPSQGLIVPMVLKLGQSESAFVSENLETFLQSGFELEMFGGQDYIVRRIPALLMQQNYEQALRDLIDELMVNKTKRSLQNQYKHLRATLACHSAIKAGELLSLPEMEQLLCDLAATSNPYLCPHEQPICMTLTTEELDRRFQR